MDDLEKRHTRIQKITRINWKLLLLGILSVLLSCTTQYKIRLTLLLFLKAELSHRYEIAWKYISQRDKEFKTKVEYLKEKKEQLPKNKEAALYQKIIDRFTEITVDSIEIDSNKAKATVILSIPEVDLPSKDSILSLYPNYAKYLKLKSLVARYLAYRDSLINLDKRLHLDIQREESLYWKDMRLRLRQLLRTRRALYHEDTLTYSMIKEGGDWRVFLGWEKVAKIREAIKKAKETIKGFIKSEILKDYESAWKNISERDKAFKTKEEYLEEKKSKVYEKNEQALLYEEMVNRLTDVKIDTIEADTNKAAVRVILKKPDTDSISNLIHMDPKKNEYLYWKAMRVKLQELIDNNEVPFYEDTIARFMIKEDEVWKVFLDWGKLNLITKLLCEAHKLEQSGWQSGDTTKLKEALNRYKQAVDLYTGPCVTLYPDLLMVWRDGEQTSIQTKIDELSVKIAYFNKIKLSNLCAKNFSKYLPQYWNITGRIKNEGDEDLTSACVIVSIFDEHGNTIEKRTYSLLWKGILEPGHTKRFDPLFLLRGPKRFRVRIQNFEFAK